MFRGSRSVPIPAASAALLTTLCGCGSGSIDFPPPTLGAVQLTPLAPTTLDDVTATFVDLQGRDGEPVDARLEWTVNGVPVQGGTTLPSSAFVRGDVIVATATPVEGSRAGEPVSSAPITVVNAPPRVLRVGITPEDPVRSDTLQAQVQAEDPDGDPLELLRLWRVDGRTVGPDATLRPPNPPGSEIVVQVRATDGELVSEPVFSDPVVIVNAAPPQPLEPFLAGEGWLPSGLTCTASPVQDPDGEPVELEIELRVDGVVERTVIASDGVVTLTPDDTAGGGLWTCRVRAVDDQGGVSAWSGSSNPVNLSCEADDVTLSPKRTVSLVYSTGFFWEDDLLRAYEGGSSVGTTDVVAWLAFDLSGVGSVRGIQAAELRMTATFVNRSPDLAVVQTSFDDWLVDDPRIDRLVRTGEISDAPAGLGVGETARFELDLERWTDGPQQDDLAFSIGVDNLSTAYSFAYFRPLGSTVGAPTLEVTVCR